jgi:hypothetical protein
LGNVCGGNGVRVCPHTHPQRNKQFLKHLIYAYMGCSLKGSTASTTQAQ